MEFSLRDKARCKRSSGAFSAEEFRPWRSQSGQGVIEYTLILVVSVSIILGAIYQLNDAFKVWAQSYFGDYIACLLETGELPNIDGSPGDSGICNQLYQPFSIANGRPLIGNGLNSKNSASSTGPSLGSRETAAGSSLGAGSYVGGGGGGFNSFNGQSGFGQSGSENNNKGNTSVGGAKGYMNYGSHNNLDQFVNPGLKYRIDTRFAFEDQTKSGPTRTPAAVTPPQQSGPPGRTLINRKDLAPPETVKNTPLTFGNFLRILIIAAIIIALVMFLGGQALNISKSME